MPEVVVEIAAADYTAHVLFEPLDAAAPSGAVGLLVELVAAGFVGVNREVFVAKVGLEAFIRELGAIARGQDGVARLESLAPGQFDLAIESRAGGLVATGRMRKVTPVGGRPTAHTLEAAFEPDPEGLPEALEALECLRYGRGAR